MKSCTTCPAYRPQADAYSLLGSDPGAPVCTRFWRLLAKPNDTEGGAERIARGYAENCTNHGELVPSGITFGYDSFTVTAPDPTIDERPVGHSAPARSCDECIHFVRDEDTKRELGWSWGLCAASGRLILPYNRKTEARDCSFGVAGTPRDTTAGLHELPIYSGTAFGVKVPARAKAPTEREPGSYVEPQHYVPDRPATDDERAYGIRGWRTYYNPKGTGQSIDAPLWDLSALDPDEQELVPMTGDDEHPEFYIDHQGLVYRSLVVLLGLDQVPTLWGRAGVGKSELWRNVAWQLGMPFRRVNIRPDTQYEEIGGYGNFSVPPWKEGQEGAVPETWWVDGIVPTAWERPGVLLIDEPNMGPDDVWALLRPLTEDKNKDLLVNGRRRRRDPFCLVGLAMNPAYLPEYVGTRQLSEADMSRLRHIFVNLPPEKVEREILLRSCELNAVPYVPDTDTLDRVMAIARDLRQMVQDGALPFSWGIREQMAVIRCTAFDDLEGAYQFALVDGLEPELASLVMGVVRTYV